MTAAEKQQHYQITVDCWRLLLKYQEPVSAQEYWERLVEDSRTVRASSFCRKDNPGCLRRNRSDLEEEQWRD